jgi:hypothetical protein
MGGMPSILIFRHGEKPGAGVGLAPRGQARAAALPFNLPVAFARADFAFAAADSDASHRPRLTITPTCTQLNLELNAKHKDKAFAEVADKLRTEPKYQDKAVLICWHHGEIPALAAALGVVAPPTPWDETVFDRFWQISYDAQGTARLTVLPQRVLFGDAEQ